MEPLRPGAQAPPIDGVDLTEGHRLLWFYKVTCPVCQMAAPMARKLAAAYPVPSFAVGQDPPDRLAQFERQFGLAIESLPDAPPYPVSLAYGIEVVPTLFAVGPGGIIADVVESWDREGYNRVSRTLAEALGAEFVPISSPGDGLPPFRPG